MLVEVLDVGVYCRQMGRKEEATGAINKMCVDTECEVKGVARSS